MDKTKAIGIVKAYMDRYDEPSFAEIGMGEYWDSGNYDDAFEYGCEVGRVRTLIEVFGLTMEDVG